MSRGGALIQQKCDAWVRQVRLILYDEFTLAAFAAVWAELGWDE